MHSQVRKNSVGRFYWRTVKRWPAIYALCCCFGRAVGVGALRQFGEIDLDALKRIFLKVPGVVMLLVNGWLIVAFITK